MVQDSGDGVQGAVGVGVVVGSGVPAVTKEWVLGVEGGAQVVPRCRGGAGSSSGGGLMVLLQRALVLSYCAGMRTVSHVCLLLRRVFGK